MNKTCNECSNITIVGGGVVGWSIAKAISNTQINSCITLIELPENETASSVFSQVESSQPSIIDFHKRIGIKETELLQRVNTNFTLGYQYKNWGGEKKNNFFLPYSEHGFILNGVEFPHHFMRLKEQDKTLSFEDFSINTHAARAKKFVHPTNNTSSIFSLLSYGLTLEIKPYSLYLKEKTQDLSANINVIPSSNVRCNYQVTNQVSHNIQSITCINDKGETLDIQTDLMIDATSKSQCQSQVSESESEVNKCSDGVFRTIYVKVKTATENEPYSTFDVINTANDIEKKGYEKNKLNVLKKTQYLSDSFECTYYFNQTITDSDMLSIIWGDLDKTVSAENVQIIYGHKISKKTPVFIKPWSGNCVSFSGLYFSTFGTFVSKLSLLQQSIEQLLDIFPNKKSMKACANYFNELAEDSYNHHCAYQELNWSTQFGELKTSNTENGYMPSNRLLREKLNLFKARGKIPTREGELFSNQHWQALFLGNQIFPIENDPLSQEDNLAWLQQQCIRMKETMIKAVDTLPSSTDYLHEKRKCKPTKLKHVGDVYDA